jgi:ParE toxin of type II toxin-antitoxin system, parDE
VRLIVRPEAEADIAEGYAWYESQQIGLGERFLSEISLRFSEIEREPLRFQRVRDEARRVLLRRFPYAVFFIQGPDYISVIAAIHMARHPAAWQKRADRDL